MVKMSDLEATEREILTALRSDLSELLTIWDYVGYSYKLSDLVNALVMRLKSTLREVVDDANVTRLGLEELAERKRIEVADLCQQLCLPHYLPDRGLSSNQLVKVLSNKVAELHTLVESRIAQYNQYRDGIVHYTRLLGESDGAAYQRLTNFPQLENVAGDCYPSSSASVPKLEELSKLQAIHDGLEAAYRPLLAQYTSLSEDITRIASEIAYQPQSPKESDFFQRTLVSSPDSHRPKDLVFVTSDAEVSCSHASSHSNDGRKRSVSACSEEDHVTSTIAPTSLETLECSGKRDEIKHPVVDSETLTWLCDLRLHLVKEKARLVGTCDELRTYLSTMWRRLDVPPDQQTELLQRLTGFRPDVLEALQDEVDKCQQAKWERLELYVGRLTKEVTRLAHTCCLDSNHLLNPENENSLCQNKDSSCDFPSDLEVVANHLETILEMLQEKYSRHRKLYDALAAYEYAWQSLVEVEVRLKDPAILSNRGGILLKAEKEKRRLIKDLQRMQLEALSAVRQYETETGTQFRLADGQEFKEKVASRVNLTNANRPSRETSKARPSLSTAPVGVSRPNSAGLSTLT